MTVRIPIEPLPAEAREALERGESVEVEREGTVVGSVQADLRSWEERLLAWQAAVRRDPPLDYDEFEKELEDIRRELNRPAEMPRWD
jgi:hypothetical protein